MAHRVYCIGCHVSATNLNTKFAPPNLNIALAGSNPDKKILNLVYDEEYDGLQGLEVFTEITTAEYLEYVRKHRDAAPAIPTMNLFTIKSDMEGNPTRAKSRIVALGNVEKRIWSQEDRYEPVLSAPAARLLLMSMAVGNGRRLKQGDCKNVFYNGTLSDDKICIVKTPSGYPGSSPGTYWILNKTLYCLARSAHYWYTKKSNHLTEDLGFDSMAQNNCVYKCTLTEGSPPIYIGLYVYDLVYYSNSDKVEQWFKNQLKSHVKVNFMDDASCFWDSVTIDTMTQMGTYRAMYLSKHSSRECLERFKLEHCKTVQTP